MDQVLGQASHNPVAGGSAAPSALDRRGRPQSAFRKALRSTLHYLSYHFVLKHDDTQRAKAAGFMLEVPPTVFHPRYFISSETFAHFIDGLDLRGKVVADIGTGSGILALAAARAGADFVLALDINPAAADAAVQNAEANGYGPNVKGLCCNLMDAIPARPIFDVIFSSPPKHAGKTRDLADAGWHSGPDNLNLRGLFRQARARLKPDGRMYLMISSDSDLDFFDREIAEAGFKARLALEKSIYIESFLLYELTPQEAATNAVSPDELPSDTISADEVQSEKAEPEKTQPADAAPLSSGAFSSELNTRSPEANPSNQ